MACRINVSRDSLVYLNFPFTMLSFCWYYYSNITTSNNIYTLSYLIMIYSYKLIKYFIFALSYMIALSQWTNIKSNGKRDVDLFVYLLLFQLSNFECPTSSFLSWQIPFLLINIIMNIYWGPLKISVNLFILYLSLFHLSHSKSCLTLSIFS